MCIDQYILVGHEPRQEPDLIKWSKWFKTADRHVAKTELPGDVKVSTVFLGLDHAFGDGPPILFETMIFGGPKDQYQERYLTWEEAEEGHKIAVAIAKAVRP